MWRNWRAVWSQQVSSVLGAAIGLLIVPGVAYGQGCMPLRFTSPSFGGQQSPYFQARDWQVGIAVRRVATNRFYVGTREDETKAPAGQPLHLRLNSADLSFTYATSERLSLTLVVPMSYSTGDNVYPDLQRHQVSSTGIGDINLIGNLWLGAPVSHLKGNVLVGFGIKAPSGSNHVLGKSYDAQGAVTNVPLVQTLQLGDGGWAVPLQIQAFRQVLPRGSVYFSGFYSVSLTQHTDVLFPAENRLWAAPDVYSLRTGFSYGIKAEPGISLSLGGRMDGTMVRDLVGGRTDFYRKPGYTMYLDPGFALQSGPIQFTLNVPVRVRHNYMTMLINNAQTVRGGAGGVSDYVIYAGFSRRF
jgi:hypothetical protein